MIGTHYSVIVRQMNRAKPSKDSKTVLVTGASSGIGYELAQRFAQDHYNLVLVARNGQKLTDLANRLRSAFGISVKVLPKDLSIAWAPDEIFMELQQALIPIDILVNNAGFGNCGAFRETSLSKELEMMQLNMVALTHLTKLFLKEMIKKGEGKILNVASTAAFQPGPLMAVYYATKAYVLSFSEALAEELRGTGVTVTCLCPGTTQSEFQKNANMEGVRLVQGKLMDAKTVAVAGYQGAMKNKRIVIPGFSNRFLVFLVRLSPRSWVTRVIKFIQKRAEH